MTFVYTKPLKEALGERGEISLPLLPQLMPTVSTVDLELLGSPAWVPWAGTFDLGAVAGQRSALEIRGVDSRLLVIEKIQTDVDSTIGMASALGIAGGGATGMYATDMRRWPPGGVGVLLIALVATATFASITATYTSVYQLRATTSRTLDFPIYLSGTRQSLIVFGGADNQGVSLYMQGRLLERV